MKRPFLKAVTFRLKRKKTKVSLENKKADIDAALNQLAEVTFTHLHCHTQFSILQSTSEVAALIAQAKELKMPAIAMTDHGNMMAAFNFVSTALKEGVKPIVGCEFFVCPDRKDKTRQNNGHQIVLLAKNKAGYQNLAKLASYAYIEGFYYVPKNRQRTSSSV